MRQDIKSDWSNKKVAVVGLGISNLELIKFLKAAGALISGRDQKTLQEFENPAQISDLGLDLVLGEGYLRGLGEYDQVFVSPGVPKNLPELSALQKKGKLSSEAALVLRYSGAPVYGITGSSGKTTTTSLIREMLRAAGISVHTGGNIGVPLINRVASAGPEDPLLLELSSFQLEDLSQSPNGAVITNIAPNHLDVHGTMDAYIRAKRNIYLWQEASDFLILNYDDPSTRAMAQTAPGRVFFFSLGSRPTPGAYLAGDDLVYQSGETRLVFSGRRHLKLLGRHNVGNVLAAALLSHLAGADWASITRVCSQFSGVRHRLELIKTVRGAAYYNDSIATTPDRTEAALHSFSRPIILIAGGSDKNLSFEGLGEVIFSRAKELILFGATAEKIKAAVLSYGDFPIKIVQDLGQAVACAAEAAQKGDVVLLSPASASYDQYSNFSARGEHFRRLVNELKEE